MAERKLQLEKEARDLTANQSIAIQWQIAPAVKLQRYSISPFYADYKDCIRFWNQFSVEVDAVAISEISKFHYLLELTKGKPREDILGLPRKIEGYEDATKILKSTYRKDIKVHRALVKELESLQVTISTQKTASIHDFYNKLSRIVRTLKILKKLDTAQSMVYTFWTSLDLSEKL